MRDMHMLGVHHDIPVVSPQVAQRRARNPKLECSDLIKVEVFDLVENARSDRLNLISGRLGQALSRPYEQGSCGAFLRNVGTE
jgi:hypothetical protein